jgi:hypothetical protein
MAISFGFILVEHIPRNTRFEDTALITLMGLCIAFYGMSLRGNFSQPSWAAADPGINLIRCLFVGVFFISAAVEVYWWIEAWSGTLDQSEMHRLFLKMASGLAMATYWARKASSRSTPSE